MFWVRVFVCECFWGGFLWMFLGEGCFSWVMFLGGDFLFVDILVVGEGFLLVRVICLSFLVDVLCMFLGGFVVDVFWVMFLVVLVSGLLGSMLKRDSLLKPKI